jgi:hypothetical protein
MKLDKLYAERRIDGETPPEKRSPLSDSKKRIQAASEMFNTHFLVDGRPKTQEGLNLSKKYYVPDYNEVIAYSLLYRVKRKFRLASLLLKQWFLFFFGSKVCTECRKPIIGLSIGTSINRTYPQHYHAVCFKEYYSNCIPKK